MRKIKLSGLMKVGICCLSAISTLRADEPTPKQENIISLVADHTEFMRSLYPFLEKEKENMVFSPYSIAESLSMLLMGARGNTESQIQSALHLNVPRKELAQLSGALTESLLPLSAKNSFELNIANALWIDQETFLLADFHYMIEHNFKAKLFMLNFSHPEIAVDKMNQWISNQTKQKITNLLSDQDINTMTRLVLTNAVYFQGSWVHPFNLKNTRKKPFYFTPETSSEVDMMQVTNAFGYYENDLIQAVLCPFNGSTNGNSSLACCVLLPKSPDNFSKVVEELQSFNEWLDKAEQKKISIQLPKFTLSTRYDLNEPLKKLGIEDAFSTNANFTGIDGMQDLSLNKVIHQVFFSLDENGVVAAAATGASMNVTSVPSKELPIEFIADHPFLFFLIDVKSHEVLFMGKCVNPAES